METNTEPMLPSEQEAIVTDEQYLEENRHENGRIFGKFSNIKEALEYYRKQEVTHTNNMRDVKEKQKSQEQEESETVQNLQKERLREQAILDIVPSFIENGMSLTDEMFAQAESVGVSKSDLELGAYKLKDALNEAHSVVGGKEEYDRMMAWAGENMSEGIKKEFDIDIQKLINGEKTVGRLAIKGMYAEYKSGNTPTRVYGDSRPANDSHGYKTQADLLRDYRAASKSGDPSLMRKHKEKVSKTHDSIVFGR